MCIYIYIYIYIKPATWGIPGDVFLGQIRKPSVGGPRLLRGFTPQSALHNGNDSPGMGAETICISFLVPESWVMGYV